MTNYKNVTIIGTGIYHPANKVGNSYYIEHFKKLGQDITDFLEKVGRNERYIVNNDTENALTMAIEASKNALKAADISAEQLDAIVFTSDTPEYLSPTNALMINHELGAVNAHSLYDLNSNCLGMLMALDQVTRYMKTSKKLKYALVVGGIYESRFTREDAKYTYPVSGDGAAAVILKCCEEEEQRGFLDSSYCAKTEFCNYVVSPNCGLSKSILSTTSEYDRKQRWTPFHMDFFVEEWCKAIKEFELNYNFTLDEIQYFFLSQYSIQYIVETAKALDIKDYKNRFPYVGDKYGYTGNTSPIFALHETLQNKPVKKGAKAVLCSVGAGSTMGSILYKF
ncbi:3-oxoacyl-ACP synthase III family protein [Clostridium oryzae]|uniref:3-oxoacyl-[acyl-carrier-protein] synthase 3 n=1 Tax=Clostridium oryzae TaxID=1450648 RepID=A0A1V4IV98_9CLOT|nr:ketoacyl-ACP synthase III [Clostridium oryzae]OPJ63962.1 3-oxoacyl-[acyl-carrier-protein] synthase 3 [Clostridium oryzae]